MASPTEIYTKHYAESHGAACEAIFQAGRTQGIVEGIMGLAGARVDTQNVAPLTTEQVSALQTEQLGML